MEEAKKARGVEDKKKQDLEDVIRAETRRGKGPIDIEERRRRAQLQRDFHTLLEEGSKDGFVKAIRALGYATARRGSSRLCRFGTRSANLGNDFLKRRQPGRSLGSRKRCQMLCGKPRQISCCLGRAHLLSRLKDSTRPTFRAVLSGPSPARFPESRARGPGSRRSARR
jgi:hypothetical protein